MAIRRFQNRLSSWPLPRACRSSARCPPLPTSAHPQATHAKKYKKNSKEWKECKGQVKPGGEPSAAEEYFAKGYWLAKTGEYVKALRSPARASPIRTMQAS